jgi:hypothetical protein
MKTNPTYVKTRVALTRAIADLKQVHADYRAEAAKTNANDLLTEAGKADALSAHRSAASAALAERRQAALEAMADHQVALEMTANPPSTGGIEDVAARIEAADARQRVRGLLNSGMPPSEILNRSASTSDLLTLDALRTEVQWLPQTNDLPGGNNEHRSPTGLLSQIDSARAALLPPEQGAALRELGAFDNARDGLLGVIDREGKTTPGGEPTRTLSGAVDDHYSGAAAYLSGAGQDAEPSSSGEWA